MADVSVYAGRSKALTVLLLVFLGGAASGVIGSQVFYRSVSQPAASAPAAVAETKLVELESLRDALSLNPTQVRQVREILDQCIMHEADLLMQIRVNQNSSRERILQILSPDQRLKFQSELPASLSEQEASF